MTHDMSTQIAACISLLRDGLTRQQILAKGYPADVVREAVIATTQEAKG